MKVAEAIAWFDQIAQQQPALEDQPPPVQRQAGGWIANPNRPARDPGRQIEYYVQEEATRWITDADSALKSVFPPGHTLVKRWDSLLDKSGGNPGAWRIGSTFNSIRAVFESAHAQLKDGRVAGLVDSIRAESVSELLDQAEALWTSKYLAAATVIAGGALESFLRHLCDRNALTWNGAGSITKYEMALTQARHAGKEIISATDNKLVTGWGGMRNDAAHSPAQFKLSGDQVRLMIDGIRDFVARRT